MPASQQTPSSQLGNLLLRGYTMMAEACPDCNIPLMRDPTTLVSQCVSCHRSYSPAEVEALSNPQHEQSPAEPPHTTSGPLTAGTQHNTAAAAAAVASPSTAHQASRPMNGPLTSALAARHRRATSTSGSSDGGASPNLAPAAAAAAAAAAPGTPPGPSGGVAVFSPPLSAVPSSNGGLGQQASMGRVYLQEATDDEVLQAYQQMRAERQRDEQQQLLHARQLGPYDPLHQQQPGVGPGPAAGVAGSTPRQQQQQQQQRPADVSQLMADKMLAGWALLGDHCPMCSTPLMRERGTRQVYCVACNLPVRLQQQQQPAAVPANGASAAAATGSTTPREQQQPTAVGAAGVPDAAAAVAVQPVSAAADGVAAGPTQQQQAVRTSPEDGQAGVVLTTPNRQQVLSGLQHTLLSKLFEAQQHLQATPVSQHEQLGQQLQLVQQLLHTLDAVQQ